MRRRYQHLYDFPYAPVLYELSRPFSRFVVDSFGVVGHIFKPRARGKFSRFFELPESSEGRLVHKEVLAGFQSGFPHVEPARRNAGVCQQLYIGEIENFSKLFYGLCIGKSRNECGNLCGIRIPDKLALCAGVFKPSSHGVDVPVVEPRGRKFKFAFPDYGVLSAVRDVVVSCRVARHYLNDFWNSTIKSVFGFSRNFEAADFSSRIFLYSAESIGDDTSEFFHAESSIRFAISRDFFPSSAA